MSLGVTQPLTEMSTRNISCRVKAAGADKLTTFCAYCLKIWEPQLSGILRAYPDL
jgi:hypothetical protein